MPDANKLTGLTDSENLGSRKVLEKCGFKAGAREWLDNVTLGRREFIVYEIERPS